VRSPLGALVDAVRGKTSADAQPPVPYVSRAYANGARYGTALYGTGSSEQQMRAMGSVGTLWSVVHHLSVDTSRACWRLYRSAASGKAEDRVEVTSHAALDLVRRPNKFMPWQEFIEVGQQHLDLTGEQWWVIARSERARSLPLELWPVRPDRMLPIPDPQRFLAGYLYLGPDGEQIPLELDQVIMLRMPNPLDPYRGMGPVQALLADLDATRYSAEWNRNFFANSAEPGGIIEVPEILGDEDFDRLRARWSEQHRGVANAHRVAILEHGRWVDRKLSQRDMQFAELRDVSREIIREAYGIPEFVLGLMENANRASALASEDMYARHLIEPRLERIKAALNTELLPMYGASGLEFDYDPVSPDDQELNAEALTAKAQAAAALVAAGYDPADVLGTVDLPEMAYVGGPAALTPPPPAAPAGPAEPAPAAPPVDEFTRIVARLLNADGQPQEQEPPPPGQLPDITAMQAAYIAALTALLTAIAEAIAAWISALIDAIRSALRGGGGLAGVQVPDVAVGEVTRHIHEAMTRVAHEAADQVVQEAADQDVTIEPGHVDDEQLGRLANDAARAVADNMAARARRSASRRRPAGPLSDDDVDRIAEGVRGELERDAESMQRADLGPAVHQGQHEGRLATLRDSEPLLTPTPAYYGSEQNDGNTCALCREVDGRWLGNTLAKALEEYPTGGYIRCLGGERCRGTIVATYRPETTTNPHPDEPGYEKRPVPPPGQEPPPAEQPPDEPEPGPQPEPQPEPASEPEPDESWHRDTSDLQDTVRDVREHDIEGEPLTGGQSARVDLFTDSRGRKIVRKTEDTTQGDPEYARYQLDAERLAAQVADAVGANVPRVYSDDPDSVWFEYIDGRPFESQYGDDRNLITGPDGIRLGLLDALTGNQDRMGNMLITPDGRLTGIDQGDAWSQLALGNPSPYLREPNSPMSNWLNPDGTPKASPPFTRAQAEQLRRRLESLRPAFDAAGRGAWLDWTLRQLAAIEQIIEED